MINPRGDQADLARRWNRMDSTSCPENGARDPMRIESLLLDWETNSGIQEGRRRVDDNTFTAVGTALDNPGPTMAELDMLHTYALPSCHRCHQRRQTTKFVCNIRGSVYKLCSCCSRRQKSTSCDLIQPYTKIGTKEGGAAMNRSVCHQITSEAAKALNIG